MPYAVAFATGSRADYGIVRDYLRLLKNTPDVELSLLVTGALLEDKYGAAVKLIEEDGFRIACRVKLPMKSTQNRLVVQSMATALDAFGAWFARETCDLLILLGDRYEMLSVAIAAAMNRVPILHFHGGEATYANYDANIDRGEFALVLTNALPAEALASINDIQEGVIPDVPAGTAYHDAVYRLYRAGILSGRDSAGTFAPADPITRAEVCVILSNMVDPSLRKTFTLTPTADPEPQPEPEPQPQPQSEFYADWPTVPDFGTYSGMPLSEPSHGPRLLAARCSMIPLCLH